MIFQRWFGPGGNPPSGFWRFRLWFPLLAGLALVLLVSACQVRGAQTGAVITVRARDRLHPVNPLIFGQNILFTGNSLWNRRLNDIDPAARPLVKNLAPTLVRFPGGEASDIYLWEDGLGFRTTTEIKPDTTTITLDGVPRWRTVHKARLLRRNTGAMGTPFTFLRTHGNQIKGVMGLSGFYPPGCIIRPGARAKQPDYFTNNYGIMEHMKFVHSLGAQAIIVVNYNTGLDKAGRLSDQASLSQKVKRAAAWVAFVNGSPEDTRSLGRDDEGNDWHTVGYWAQRRVTLGHPAPYGVKYWEVGNEEYDKNNTGGFAPARTYAHDFVTFARAMKAVDPDIKVGAVGLTFPRGRGDADCRDAWNPTVIRIAGAAMDFLVLHPYYPAAGPKPAPYDSQAWYTAVMAAASQALADIQQVRQVIQKNGPPGKKVGIAITEYGIWPADSKNPKDWANLGRALYDAGLIMGLLRDGPKLGVNLAANWILSGSMATAAIGYDWHSGTRTLRPDYYAMELLRKLRSVVVKTQVASPTFSVSRVGNVMARKGIPLLGALATISRDGRRLTLLVINRGLAAPMPATIHLRDYRPQAAARVFKVMGPRLSANNEDNPKTVTLTTAKVSGAAPDFKYTFAPHSLTLFQFQAQSGN
jgi:alpha-L-arabinofuranosidase